MKKSRICFFQKFQLNALFCFHVKCCYSYFGLLTFAKIGIDRDPNVDSPFVTVGIHYKGMNPKTSEQLLLNPMEEVFKSLPGLKKFSRNSSARIELCISRI